jgi:hypothetical protein
MIYLEFKSQMNAKGVHNLCLKGINEWEKGVDGKTAGCKRGRRRAGCTGTWLEVVSE